MFVYTRTCVEYAGASSKTANRQAVVALAI